MVQDNHSPSKEFWSGFRDTFPLVVGAIPFGIIFWGSSREHRVILSCHHGNVYLRFCWHIPIYRNSVDWFSDINSHNRGYNVHNQPPSRAVRSHSRPKPETFISKVVSALGILVNR